MMSGNEPKGVEIARAVAELHATTKARGIEPSKFVAAMRTLVDDAAIAHTMAQLDPRVDEKTRAWLATMHRELKQLLRLAEVRR